MCVCFGRVGCPRSNVGSRLFLMADDSKYQVFKLKNRSHLTPAAPPRLPDSVSIRARLPTLHMHQLVPCLCTRVLHKWPHDAQFTTASPIFPTAARRLPRPFRPRPSSSCASEHIGWVGAGCLTGVPYLRPGPQGVHVRCRRLDPPVRAERGAVLRVDGCWYRCLSFACPLPFLGLSADCPLPCPWPVRCLSLTCSLPVHCCIFLDLFTACPLPRH